MVIVIVKYPTAMKVGVMSTAECYGCTWIIMRWYWYCKLNFKCSRSNNLYRNAPDRSIKTCALLRSPPCNNHLYKGVVLMAEQVCSAVERRCAAAEVNHWWLIHNSKSLTYEMSESAANGMLQLRNPGWCWGTLDDAEEPWLMLRNPGEAEEARMMLRNPGWGWGTLGDAEEAWVALRNPEWCPQTCRSLASNIYCLFAWKKINK